MESLWGILPDEIVHRVLNLASFRSYPFLEEMKCAQEEGFMRHDCMAPQSLFNCLYRCFVKEAVRTQEKLVVCERETWVCDKTYNVVVGDRQRPCNFIVCNRARVECH